MLYFWSHTSHIPSQKELQKHYIAIYMQFVLPHKPDQTQFINIMLKTARTLQKVPECTDEPSTLIAHFNHVTSSKREDTLLCHTTMRRNSINFLHNSGHVTL